jgi:hypothetical protein
VTEAEWLACEDPVRMLEFLRGKVSERKLRLFACACYRRFHEHFVPDDDGDGLFAVELAEAYADGDATAADLAEVRGEIVECLWDAQSSCVVRHRVAECATVVPLGDVTRVADAFILWLEANVDESEVDKDTREEHAYQAVTLRDLFGNPFRPTAAKPAWLTWNSGTVTKLARDLYDARAFDRLPLLADALEDAGCSDAEILGHLRSPGPHVRGCWAVDLVLGKA